MTSKLIFVIAFLASSSAFADAHELMRDTLKMVSHKIYQREKKIITSTIAKIDELKIADIENPVLSNQRLLLFAANALYPIVESFPSIVFEEKVLPAYADALGQFNSEYNITSLNDIYPEPKEVAALGIHMLQQGVSYSETLFHDAPEVTSEKLRLLADILIGIQSDDLDCSAFEQFGELEVITTKLMSNPDVDRTKGVAMMMDAILAYFEDMQEYMPCK